MSLNKCFTKVLRTKGEPGKGGFWVLDPEFEREPTPPPQPILKKPQKNILPKFPNLDFDVAASGTSS